MILWLCFLCSVYPSYSLLSTPIIKNRLNHLNAFQYPGTGEIVNNNWIYSDLFDEEKLKLIESVTITENSKQAYVVDSLHGQQSIEPNNIHMIQLIPDDIHNLIDKYFHLLLLVLSCLNIFFCLHPFLLWYN